jgi:50S ribosomal protein L16 3-hydroxylase
MRVSVASGIGRRAARSTATSGVTAEPQLPPCRLTPGPAGDTARPGGVAIFSQWLRTLSHADFLTDVYLRRPYSVAQGANHCTSLLTWDIFWNVMPRCGPSDLLVVRDARLWTGSDPKRPEDGQAFVKAGYSLVLRHAERFDEGMATLAAGFSADFGAPVAIQLYATPQGHSSFGWHYDAEEVFILQTAGTKRYLLRENTVRPHPLLDAMPRDQQFEREVSPKLCCDLIPGDWLYVPSGTWHVARAEADSLSISIGVAALTAMDLYDELRSVFAASPVWRQRLSPVGHPTSLLDALRDEAIRLWADPRIVREAIDRVRSTSRPTRPCSSAAIAGTAPGQAERGHE